jgi:hypothetical protein
MKPKHAFLLATLILGVSIVSGVVVVVTSETENETTTQVASARETDNENLGAPSFKLPAPLLQHYRRMEEAREFMTDELLADRLTEAGAEIVPLDPHDGNKRIALLAEIDVCFRANNVTQGRAIAVYFTYYMGEDGVLSPEKVVIEASTVPPEEDRIVMGCLKDAHLRKLPKFSDRVKPGMKAGIPTVIPTEVGRHVWAQTALANGK